MEGRPKFLQKMGQNNKHFRRYFIKFPCMYITPHVLLIFHAKQTHQHIQYEAIHLLFLLPISPPPPNPLFQGRSHPWNMQESLERRPPTQLQVLHHSPPIQPQKPNCRSFRTWVHLNPTLHWQCQKNGVPHKGNAEIRTVRFFWQAVLGCLFRTVLGCNFYSHGFPHGLGGEEVWWCKHMGEFCHGCVQHVRRRVQGEGGARVSSNQGE